LNEGTGTEAASRETAALESALGYSFRDSALLERALRHSSYAHENGDGPSNERLEFLGDAVVGLVVARLLFDAHPDWREGDLTRGLHSLVDQRALAELGRELDVGAHLLLGRTEIQSAGETKDSVLADATEAVLAAMFLDGGLEPVVGLARRVFADALAADAPRVSRDPKTDLQERVMSRFREFPEYVLEHDSEVEADPLRFTVSVLVEGEVWGEGAGRSKRIAERAAAGHALATRATDLSGPATPKGPADD
jgi:ribonuclease-3